MRFVAFVEAAELEIMEKLGSHDSMGDIKRQISEMYRQGFEIGLHLHPQWYNARYENNAWLLDYGEYNLCLLSRKRIMEIIDRSITYLRNVLGVSEFSPLAFRAGNWLFQPTGTVADLLAAKGIKIDSSVFKGGLQRDLNLDYRPAQKNGYFWRFQEDVNVDDPGGKLMEFPTYTEMVPSWKMVTAKRMNMTHKRRSAHVPGVVKLRRYLDFIRWRYPLKLDFCRMTLNELVRMMEHLIGEERKDPTVYRPIVAIGHTKDLVDIKNVALFIGYLKERGIAVSTFAQVYARTCLS